MFETRISDMPGILDDDCGFDMGPYLGSGSPNFRQLVSHATSCSPFLRSIAERDAEWLAALAGRSPDEVLSELLSADIPGDAGNAARLLRIAKKRVAILTALADLGGVWSLQETMAAMTGFADLAVQTCLQAILRKDGRGEGPPELLDGMFVLAMGKMGACELNYSSDVDLIILFDDQDATEAELQVMRSRFVRATRRFVSMMSSHSEGGYVFRTDLRLRPDPLVTPVCISAEAAERYYESFGRTWERAAFIKARPCAGDREAGDRFLQALEPFIWRRSLDFASVEDARNMRRMIKQQVEIDQAGGGSNLKLGRGGIRDIEMMTQSMQMIAGGRDHSLRVRDTLGGLSVLSSRGWMHAETRTLLGDSYTRLRRIEHRLQMVNDLQTHSLPAGEDDLRRVAALSGESDIEAFVGGIEAVMRAVDRVTGDYFSTSNAGSKDLPPVDVSPDILEAAEGWRRFPVMRSERARTVFSRILPTIMSGLQRSPNQGQAISQFEGFLRGLPAGIQLFSLLESNPVLIDLLTDICGTAPGLSAYLARNSQVLDAVLDGNFFDRTESAPELAGNLDSILSREGDFESILDASRRWMKDHHFRIGVQHLRGHIDWEQSARCYADVAEAVLRSLLDQVITQLTARHGSPPGRGVAIIGMGSLGAGRLTAQSDLDLLVIFDPLQDGFSNGPRPLPARKYFARLTQGLVSALSAQTVEGRLYSIDMRLRPSGNQGPVATSLAAFEHYQNKEAWAWEHMALTRARQVAGSGKIGQEFERIRRQVIMSRGRRPDVIDALRSMRSRLEENLPANRDQDPWEARLGRGRLLDIELVVQAGALVAGEYSRSISGQLAAGAGSSWLRKEEAEALLACYATLRQLLQVARLTVDSTFRPEEAGEGAVAFLLRETGEADTGALATRLQKERRMCREIIRRVIDRNSQEEVRS